MEGKTKICHLSSVHLALDTRLFYRFCLSLANHYEVSLIAVHPEPEIIRGIKIIPFRRFKSKLLRVSVTWLIMFFKAWRQKAELYQIHDPELIPCGLMLKWLGKKVILDIHENIAEDIFDKPWIRNKKLLYAVFGFFERIAVKNFFIFLAELSYEARYKAMGARYEIVLNYQDPDFFKNYQVKKRGGNRVFYIGILLHSRGIIEIAKALHILKGRGIEVHFDVVGELYTGLDEEIDALEFIGEIKLQLHFHGRQPLEKGYEISREAAAGMCIIHPMKNSVGSYPTKMFEFMAIGLPQVISDFPLYRSVVEEYQCGICVNPLDSEAIANAIEAILLEKERSGRMSENAIKASAHFTWDGQFAKALKAYKSMLK